VKKFGESNSHTCAAVQEPTSAAIVAETRQPSPSCWPKHEESPTVRNPHKRISVLARWDNRIKSMLASWGNLGCSHGKGSGSEVRKLSACSTLTNVHVERHDSCYPSSYRLMTTKKVCVVLKVVMQCLPRRASVTVWSKLCTTMSKFLLIRAACQMLGIRVSAPQSVLRVHVARDQMVTSSAVRP
jgi:hypothetical protein